MKLLHLVPYPAVLIYQVNNINIYIQYVFNNFHNVVNIHFIPIVPELGQAFELSDHDFKSKFNRPKPSIDAPLIFSCLKGGRAQKATDLAVAQGFKK